MPIARGPLFLTWGVHVAERDAVAASGLVV